jgi:small conductance mechanosensitive channel
MDKFWQDLGARVEAMTAGVVGAALILVVGLLAVRYLVPPLRRLLERSRIEPAIVSFLANSVRGILLAVIIIGILQRLGVPTGSLLTVLATAGLAVALSLQTTLANFTAGLLLLSFRMLRVGDLIDTGTIRGRVSEMYPFHVVLVTDENQVANVPNSLLTVASFRNYTALPTRRMQWLLTLRAGDDLSAAKDLLRSRLLTDPRVHRGTQPRIFVQEWSEEKRVLAVQAWTGASEAQSVQEELLEGLGEALAVLRTKESRPSEEPDQTSQERKNPG